MLIYAFLSLGKIQSASTPGITGTVCDITQISAPYLHPGRFPAAWVLLLFVGKQLNQSRLSAQ